MAWDDLSLIADLENNESDQGVKKQETKSTETVLGKMRNASGRVFFQADASVTKTRCVNPLKGHR